MRTKRLMNGMFGDNITEDGRRVYIKKDFLRTVGIVLILICLGAKISKLTDTVDIVGYFFTAIGWGLYGTLLRRSEE